MNFQKRPLLMDEPQIYARLEQIFRDVFDEDTIEVTPSLSARDVDGWDSLTHIRLLLTVEKAFRIKFSTFEVGKLQDVSNLVALIKSRVCNDQLGAREQNALTKGTNQ
jgi:acyl carrier protein